MAKKRKYLVIHCSATPNTMYVNGEMIKRWHTNPKDKGGNGWKQVGYETVIRRDGTVDKLIESNGDDIVDAWEITNGARGINSVSAHICLIGGYDEEGNPNLDMTPEMHDALVGEIKNYIMEQSDIQIAAHYHFSSKTCPNFPLEEWLEEIGCAEENIYRG